MEIYSQNTITDTNAAYHGLELSELMDSAGAGIAKCLIKKYGTTKTYAFVCGLGNNGGDGFAAAQHLVKLGVPIKQIKVYLIGRVQDIKTKAALAHWELLKSDDIAYQQDAYGKDVVKADVIVECLLGTGIKGKLFKRFNDVIYRITRLKTVIVAVDMPVPGYKWDYSISISYPKTPDAEVVELDIPDYIHTHTGPGEVKLIQTPHKFSYKNKNGRVLIIGGSEKYHGAPVLAAQSAANYAGLVYLYSPVKDINLLGKMNKMSNEFISVFDNDFESTVEKIDSILIGPGLEQNYVNAALINALLHDYPHKRFVIDAAAIAMADKKLVKNSGNVIFTPHKGELAYLGDLKTTNYEGALKRYAVEHNCYINFKGAVSLLFGPNGEFKFNRAGNAGMARGGSGDALAGLTAAFASVNELWLSMGAAAFVNGLAGEMAAQEYGSSYSVNETIDYQQKAFKFCQEFSNF